MEVTVYCATQDQYTANVIHFDILSVVGTVVTDVLFGTTLEAVLAPLFKAILPTNCSYIGLKTQVIAPVRLDAQITTALAGAGTLAGDCLPTQVAGLVSMKTGFASRSKRGRMYLPATSEADNTALAQPSAGYLTLMTNIANALLAFNLVVSGGNQVACAWSVYSRKLHEMTVITQTLIRDDWATQRRRSQIKHSDSLPF